MNGLFVFGEEVPRVAALLDDVVVTVEDGDGEFVGAQVGPDVFDRVEFRRVWRQGEKCDVVGGVIQATWPPAGQFTDGPWTIRDGAGGGKRVSAATGNAPVSNSDIELAQAAMTALKQPVLFMIRLQDENLDRMLAARDYVAVDPVNLYACPIHVLTNTPPQKLSAFTVWPPLEIMRELWAAGGIGPGRIAVMNRATGAKTALLARCKGRPAGTAFAAIHNQIGQIHAVEVTRSLRRNGTGINIMRAAAQWAQDQGARYFSALVTDANAAANALYTKLGMTVVGHYHYRIRQK